MINRLFRNRFGRGGGAGVQGSGGGRGQGRGGGAGQGQGRGRPGGNKAGPGGNCVCPKCGKKVPHVAGQPCTDQVCPDCGTCMVKE